MTPQGDLLEKPLHSGALSKGWRLNKKRKKKKKKKKRPPKSEWKRRVI